MSKSAGRGGMRINGLVMQKFTKKYFDTYSDAQIWLDETTKKNDKTIRKENGKYFIFVEQQEETN